MYQFIYLSIGDLSVLRGNLFLLCVKKKVLMNDVKREVRQKITREARKALPPVAQNEKRFLSPIFGARV